MTLERGETATAYCSVQGESLQFDQRFRPFSSHFATMKFYKVKFTYRVNQRKRGTFGGL